MKKGTKNTGGGSREGCKTAASSSAGKNDDAVVETTTQETQPTQDTEETVESPASEEEVTNEEENQEEEAAKVESKSAEEGENEEEANENQEEEAAKVKSKSAEEGENEEEAKPDSATHPEKDESASQNEEAKGAYSSQPQHRRGKKEARKIPIRRDKTTKAQGAKKRNLAHSDDPMDIDDAASPMETSPMETSPQLLEDVIAQLWKTHLCPIEMQLTEKVYGRVMIDILSKSRAVGDYFVSTDGLVESITFRTNFSTCFLSEDGVTRQRRIGLGWVRDQGGHFLCWDYVSTDLVSEANVRAGWDEHYRALSAWHLCMACRPDRIGNDMEAAKKNHMCYAYPVDAALNYMKDFGIPPPETNPEFNCHFSPVSSSEPLIVGRIEKVTTIDRLEEALCYLPVLPIGADLIAYSQLFDKTDEIYYGPLQEKVCFRGYHAVIIESVKEYRGDYIAVCKMSNGTEVGHNGYTYVSLTTMYYVTAVDSTKTSFVRATPEPMRLLSNFVAVQVVQNKWKNYENYRRAKKNEEEARNLSASSSQPRPQDLSASSSQSEAEPEYFKEKRILEDLWKAAVPVGTEDALYEVNWNFKNVEDALEEGGKLHGKKVYVFGCTESQLLPHKNEDKTVIVPTVICIESTIPPSDKIGVASVQGEVEKIIPMDWFPYIPLEKGDSKMNFQIFILGCSRGRSALKHSTDDHVQKFNYCLPYINNPFKVDESEQSTVVQIMFPSEPPVECEYDWVKSDIEEFTDNLIKEEVLLAEQKDAFEEFVKKLSDKAKTAYEEVKQARDKAKEGMSEETKEAYKEMKLYKFYPLPSPDTADVAGINKSSVINKYLGKAHEVF